MVDSKSNSNSGVFSDNQQVQNVPDKQFVKIQFELKELNDRVKTLEEEVKTLTRLTDNGFQVIMKAIHSLKMSHASRGPGSVPQSDKEYIENTSPQISSDTHAKKKHSQCAIEHSSKISSKTDIDHDCVNDDSSVKANGRTLETTQQSYLVRKAFEGKIVSRNQKIEPLAQNLSQPSSYSYSKSPSFSDCGIESERNNTEIMDIDCISSTQTSQLSDIFQPIEVIPRVFYAFQILF